VKEEKPDRGRSSVRFVIKFLNITKKEGFLILNVV